MKILVATDAWYPQVNGVVRTYTKIADAIKPLGAEISFLTPDLFRTIPCPTYPEIRLAIPDMEKVRSSIEDYRPNYIHIGTEGPVGCMVRRYCRRQGISFTTSFHTRFPEYLRTFIGVPESVSYGVLRRFHNAGCGTMVATPSLEKELLGRGFKHVLHWTRGVDTEKFKPRRVRLFGSDRPVFLYVGRLSREKNIEAFLDLTLPGHKVVVGDGPHRNKLQSRYPDVQFTGTKHGSELAECYASADVFVFPSRTDTFGLVILEAIASGLPVVAYPVTGPKDIIRNNVSGILSEDLQQAALKALHIDRAATRDHALEFSWSRSAEMFLENIERANKNFMLGAARSCEVSSAQFDVANSAELGPC